MAPTPLYRDFTSPAQIDAQYNAGASIARASLAWTIANIGVHGGDPGRIAVGGR